MRANRLGLTLAVVLCLGAGYPGVKKGDRLYVSAVGMDFSLPTGWVPYVALDNLDCPTSSVGCFFVFRPCQSVEVKSVKKSGALVVWPSGFTGAVMFEGEWQQVLAPDRDTCLHTLTHAQIRISEQMKHNPGEQYESEKVDCEKWGLPTPCESDRPRPIIEDRAPLSVAKVPGWIVHAAAQ